MVCKHMLLLLQANAGLRCNGCLRSCCLKTGLLPPEKAATAVDTLTILLDVLQCAVDRLETECSQHQDHHLQNQHRAGQQSSSRVVCFLLLNLHREWLLGLLSLVTWGP